MPYRPLDHTADLRIVIDAGSRAGLFEESAMALCDTITEVAGVAAVVDRRLQLASRDLESLLVAWLEELLFLFDTESLLLPYAEVSIEAARGATEVGLRARLRGETFDPDRHPLGTVIKAVTYHALDVSRTEDGWRAQVIFDI